MTFKVMGIYNNAMPFFNILLTVDLSLNSGNLRIHFFSFAAIPAFKNCH